MMKKIIAILFSIASCDASTNVVVDNGFVDSTVVIKTWWQSTLIPDAVAAGAESPSYLAVPGDDYAYVVLQRVPGAFIVARTSNKISVDRQDTLHITISPATITGDCANGSVLTQAEADMITQSIFPAEFAGATYDAATCKYFR